MKPPRPHPAPRRPLRGQSSLEYLVGLALVVGLFGLPAFNGRPLLMHFAAALGTGFSRFLSALALPV